MKKSVEQFDQNNQFINISMSYKKLGFSQKMCNSSSLRIVGLIEYKLVKFLKGLVKISWLVFSLSNYYDRKYCYETQKKT